MTLTLSIVSEDTDLTDEKLVYLAEEVCETLNRELDVDARLATTGGAAEHKGDAVTIGTIIVTIFGGGGVAVALVNALSTFFNRGTRINIEVKTGSGESFKIEASNLSTAEINKTIERIRKLLGAPA